jgi:hypothetical protein
MANRKTGRPATCEHCARAFLSYRTTVRYCSRTCSGKASRTPGDKSGRRNPRFNFGFSTWQGRAIVVLRNGGHQLYSRALMEGHLGRHLLSSEIVHHVNEDPTDDRIENLQVVTRAEHLAIHRDKLQAAKGMAA